MIRNLLPWTAGCLLAAFAVSSCESDDVDYGPISAAIEIGVEEVTPSSAKIRLTTEQENVASYKIVKPTPISEFEYAAHDAIDRLAFIEERGEAAGAPFEQTLAGLMPKVEYSFAVVGLDASGQRITAPTFARFTTAYASSLVEARFETNPDETFTFTGKITPNAYTVSYRYIFDSDHNEATEAELRALLEAGGSGVKTDKGVKELELVKSDKAGVTLAVLSYDDANRPGEFTSTFVSTEDMASVIVDGKETQLARPTEGVDIFEGKVAVPAKSGFTVEINKVAYGFAPYSGNGGVGKVENMMSAAPYYSSSTIADSRGYDCKMAVGRMAATADGGNDFWTNLSEDAQILVRVDLTLCRRHAALLVGTGRGRRPESAARTEFRSLRLGRRLYVGLRRQGDRTRCRQRIGGRPRRYGRGYQGRCDLHDSQTRYLEHGGRCRRRRCDRRRSLSEKPEYDGVGSPPHRRASRDGASEQVCIGIS